MDRLNLMETADARKSSVVVVGGEQFGGGTVRIAGFKHSLVTIFAAALAINRPVVIHNCPDILETRVLVDLINAIGGQASFVADTLRVDATSISNPALDSDEAEKIHGSAYLVPALLARFRTARILTGRGGCQIGSAELGRRPWEHYVRVLSLFGADTVIDSDGGVAVNAVALRGCDIDLLDFTVAATTATGPHYSGASKMAVLAAAVAQGTSRLRHLYPKPDVTDLVSFLELAGIDIARDDAGTITIAGNLLNPVASPLHVTLAADLIEVVTYSVAAALYCRESLELLVPEPERTLMALAPEVAALERLGVRLEARSQSITASRYAEPGRGKYIAESHGIYSDNLPFLLLLAMSAQDESTFSDTVWPNRFQYLEGLTAMGGVFRRIAEGAWTVLGPCPPVRPGATVHAAELRGAATLVMAALGVPGRTAIFGTHHLSRGYPSLLTNLRDLGADITVSEREA